MKKALSLLLAVLMLVSVLSGCRKKSDKGPIIPVYISDQIVNFDPAFAYNDDAAAKILPLLFEGLTRIDSKGKVKNAVMEKYTYGKTEQGTYMMEVTLKESYWSDTTTVSADDFVYAFKRIMDPEFSSEAAALLYDLQNAREVKAGTKSIDDLGVRSAERTVLQFIFDKDIDVDAWLETLASPALVPLREMAVANLPAQDEVTAETVSNDGVVSTMIKLYDIPAYAWSTDPTNLLTNGPFRVKSYEIAERAEDGSLILERNAYYRRAYDSNEHVAKYVEPNQLKIVFPSTASKGDYQLGANESAVSVQQLMAYASLSAEDKSRSVVFDSDLALVSGTEKTQSVDMLTQHVYYFNTENKLFADAQVRRALSLAIDRNKITELVSGTTAAGGWVMNGIYKDSGRKTTYRESYGSLVEASANVDEAKKLLSQAGVRNGKFTLTVRDSAVETVIAEYVEDVWESLGFTVDVKKAGFNNRGLDGTEQTKYYYLQRDELASALISGDFDVIALDYTAMSTYAFASLSPFAIGYTGGAISLKELTLNPEYNSNIPHTTGWHNDSYDNLINRAYEEKDLGKRSDLLFDAEKILMEEMPVMPLVQYKNVYKKTGALSGLSTDYYGAVHFDRAKLKKASDYIAATEAEQ